MARKSLVAKVDRAAGTRFERDMVVIKRPGTGLQPGRLEWLIGRTARSDIAGGSVITPDMV